VPDEILSPTTSYIRIDHRIELASSLEQQKVDAVAGSKTTRLGVAGCTQSREALSALGFGRLGRWLPAKPGLV
jgi:hypothetical protein